VIATGTLLGGRYLIEGERPGDHDGELSWWALDRQLRRRVAVVVLPEGAGAGPGYAGRLLDGGEHEGHAYLVIRAEPSAADGGPGADLPPPPEIPRPPELPADATRAFPQPDADATAVQPLPAMATPPPLPLPPLAAPGPAPGNRTLLRSAALMGASFLLGAGGVLTVAVLAAPDPPPATPASAAPGDTTGSPTATLPTDTETTEPSSSLPGFTWPRFRTPTTRSTRPTTTRKNRGKPTTTDDGLVP
jgi:hypothetical protein